MKRKKAVFGVLLLFITAGCAEIFDKEAYTEDWSKPTDILEKSVPQKMCEEREIGDTEQKKCISDAINNLNKV